MCNIIIMADTDIVNYIKSNYPKLVFEKVNLSAATNRKRALGFIVTDDKLVIGYITKDGGMCKVVEPIDLQSLSHENFIKFLRQIPVVQGFDETDKQKLIQLLAVSDELISRDKLINEMRNSNEELQKQVHELQTQYSVFVDASKLEKSEVEKSIVLIKSEHEAEIARIKYEFDTKTKALQEACDTCKDRILNEKELIIDAIKKYKIAMQEYIANHVNKHQDAQDLITKLTKEKAEIEYSLEQVKKNDAEKLAQLEQEEELRSDFSFQINAKQEEINKLNETIETIKKELADVQNKFSKSEIENKILTDFRAECIARILNEKEVIIQKIKDYNKAWIDWAQRTNFDKDIYKQKLQEEMSAVTQNLKDLLQNKTEYIQQLEMDAKTKAETVLQLENNIAEIKKELANSASQQMDAISCKDSEQKDVQIAELKRQLEEVRGLLQQNNNTPVEVEIDYTNCKNLFQKFKVVNNIFARKQEVINRLDKLIYKESDMGVFGQLSDDMKETIKKKYQQVREEINKYIKAMDLMKFSDHMTINTEIFNTKESRKNIPPNLCDDLIKISDYWDANVKTFRAQDMTLTNIYEDLSGAVRVYIKIKPLIGVEQKTNTVYIKTIETKKQKSVVVDCSQVAGVNRTDTFGDFFGIFDEDFSNLDVYTGVQGSKPNSGEFIVDVDAVVADSETVSPGLYSAFKQVEDGYSIVLFGYGLSGSGKTRLLIGEAGNPRATPPINSVPGLIHYGLANLQGVKNIKIRNIFEQYMNEFNPTPDTKNLGFGQDPERISGKLFQLVGRITGTDKVSVTENLKGYLTDNNFAVDLNSITVDDLFTLTTGLEKYRKERGRIKKTPNNPVSSRSHLYIVFEISFTNNKTGYVTLVDTAGRESPRDIYNLFIDTSHPDGTFEKVLDPRIGLASVTNSLRSEVKNDPEYTPQKVYEILKEGVYINETINHLIYFFKKKNNAKHTTIKQKEGDMSSYEPDKYFILPMNEENKTDFKPKSNVMTIPIMKYLDSLTKTEKADNEKGNTSFRPTKFITFVCVRKDEKYCGQIFDTLKFAEAIKSS